MRTTTSSLGLITTHTPISGVESGVIEVVPVPMAAFASEIPIEKSKPIAKPALIAEAPTMKCLREVFVIDAVICIPLSLANCVNGFAYLLEGSATTNITNSFINLVVSWLWVTA